MKRTQQSYREQKRRKWYLATFLAFLGALVAAAVIYGIYFTAESTYNRGKFDNFIKSRFGELKMKDAITAELMLVAYAYNIREPRFYTKHTALTQPKTFDIPIAEAVEASISFPGYFKPFVSNGEVLVDGSLIANNPAYYADCFARHLYDQKNIKTFSIGAGRPEVVPFGPQEQVSAFTWIQRLQSLILAAGMKTHHAMSRLISTDEHRFQVFTDIGFDEGSKIDKLERMGQDLYQLHYPEISLLLDELLKKKFGQ